MAALILRGCTSPPPPVQVELLAVAHWMNEAGRPVAAFERSRPVRWRVHTQQRPSPIVTATDRDGRVHELATQVRPSSPGWLIRTLTSSLAGTYEMRLEGGIRGRPGVIWQNTVRLLDEPGRALGFEDLEKSWEADRAATEARLRALTKSQQPWVRYAAYRLWGRSLRGEDPVEAERIYDLGASDPWLKANLPTGACGLRLSSAFVLVDLHRPAVERLAQARSCVAQTKSAWQEAAYWLYASHPLIYRRQHGAAIEGIRNCQRAAYREELDEMLGHCALLASDQMIAIGRYRDAVRLLTEVQPTIVSAHVKFVSALNQASAQLDGREAGAIDISLGELISTYERLVAAAEEAGTPGDRAQVAAALAYLEMQRGRHGRARTHASRITIAAERFGFGRWFIQLVQAEVWLRSGDLARAERELEALIAAVHAEVGGPGPHEAVALQLLSEVYAGRGDRPRARRTLERAWQVSLQASRRLDLVEARTLYLSAQARLPVRLAQQRFEAGDALGAVAVLDATLTERWSQLAALAVNEARPEAWAKVDAARRAWEKLSRAGCAGLAPALRPACNEDIEAARHDADLAQMAFYRGLDLPPRTDVGADIAAVQRSLQKGSGILIAMGRGDALQAYLVETDHVTSATGTEALRTLAPRLDALKHLVNVSPLDITQAKSPDGRPWGERLTVTRRPGIVLPARRSRGGGGARALVDPTSDLPKSLKSARRIAAAQGAQITTGPGATVEALRKALGASPDLLLYTGHAKAPKHREAASHLQLADGAFEMQDILTAPKTARVAILNGCSTGGRRTGIGVGLPEALLVRGADAVLATVEPVLDDASDRFVARFLEAGGAERPRAAFRAAIARSIEAQDPVWQHYRLWARAQPGETPETIRSNLKR